jgi:eukaryotic-like serine/threonine-protein kinase
MMGELQAGDPPSIGPYRLLGRLGTGGMGQVYLGRSAGGRPVAVKVIRPDLAQEPDFRARFAREVAAARHVSGQFTALVVGADVDGPVPWLATAYVAGPSLTEAVARHGPLPAEWVVLLAAGLAEGLGGIHAAGVVHRDLKPGNVLLADDGPRVIDFGISRATESSMLTVAGTVVGSPGFMSPEQAEGGDVGPASDVFSLGAVLTFAATGAGPFGSGTTPALVYRVVHAEPDIAGLPDQLRLLVRRCLAKDPAGRPSTDELLAELGDGRPDDDWLPGPLAGVISGYDPPRSLPSGPGGPGPAGSVSPDVIPTGAIAAGDVSAQIIPGGAVLADAAPPGVPADDSSPAAGPAEAIVADVWTDPGPVPAGPGPGDVPARVPADPSPAEVPASGPPGDTARRPARRRLAWAAVGLGLFALSASVAFGMKAAGRPVPASLDRVPRSSASVPAGLTTEAGSPSAAAVSGGSAAGQGTVPALRGMTLSAASAAVGARGFGNVSYAYNCYGSADMGHVVRQSPGAGSRLPLSTPVELYLQAKDCVTVPDVTGMDLADALAALKAAGFASVPHQYDCYGFPVVGEVVSQSPAGRTRATTTQPVSLELQAGDCS